MNNQSGQPDIRQLTANMLIDILDNLHNSIRVITKLTISLLIFVIIKIRVINSIPLKDNESLTQFATNILTSNHIHDFITPTLILFGVSIGYKLILQMPNIYKHYIKLILQDDLTFADELRKGVNRYYKIIKCFIVVILSSCVGSTMYLIDNATPIVVSFSTLSSALIFSIILFNKKISINSENDLLKHLVTKILETPINSSD